MKITAKTAFYRVTVGNVSSEHPNLTSALAEALAASARGGPRSCLVSKINELVWELEGADLDAIQATIAG